MGKAWVKARRRDPYYRAAKAQGLRSRAVFKLLQIHERFGLVYPGDLILDLARAALDLGRKALRPGGRFVAKTFQGDGYRGFLREVAEDFGTVKGYVTPATSPGSSETYVVGLERIG